MPIILKDKDFKDDAKLKRQKKRADKILAQTKNNVQRKDYISCMCFYHI